MPAAKYREYKGRRCDCGKPAIHFFNGYECARCFLLRRHYEKTERQVMAAQAQAVFAARS